MIDFEMSEGLKERQQYAEWVAKEKIRPNARYYDDPEHEHEFPWDFAHFIWNTGRKKLENLNPDASFPGEPFMLLVHINEMLGWGDLGFFMSIPWPALGGSAIKAVGTPEQKALLQEKFRAPKPTWTCMALSESHCGSDSSAIRVRATRDQDSWIINGEKLFVSTAKMSMLESDGLFVVWATIDPSAGHKGIRPFLLEASTPGVKIAKLENKLGLRASDTAVVNFEDCRVPLESMLGGLETSGFKGVMKTFDAARPSAAAAGIGVARATLEFVKEQYEAAGNQLRYEMPRTLLSSMERDIIEMEGQLRAAWLLVVKTAWLIDQNKPNTLEASMCKAKAGETVSKITQKGIELMGVLGYSRALPLEKWMRDARITDIYEGTGQINRLVVARKILGYSGKELR